MTISNYNLPDSWLWVNLGEITQSVDKVSPKSNPAMEFVYLDIASIDNKQQKIVQPKKYLGKNAPSRARQQLKSGDILFSTVRTYLKNIAMVDEKYDEQIASTGFCVLRAFHPITNKFIFQWVQTDSFITPLSQIQRGTSYPACRDSDVLLQQIPLPPLPEQRRIVAKIEELFTQLDAGVEALNRVKSQLKRYRQAVLKHAFEGKLTAEWREKHKHELEPASVLLERIREERKKNAKGKYKEPPPIDTSDLPALPERWCYTHIQPLLSITRTGIKTGPFGSLLKKHEHTLTGVPVLGIENIKAMKFVHGSKIHISQKKAQQLAGYDIQEGDILISRSGTVGEVCVVPQGIGEARFSTNLMRLSLTTSAMLPEFLCVLVNGSPFVLHQVSELCKGSTRNFLNQTILSSIVFQLPPLREQRQIVDEIERHLTIAEDIENTIELSLRKSERLRQSILKRAFEGKLVLQDPSDEPAENLLERIRQANVGVGLKPTPTQIKR